MTNWSLAACAGISPAEADRLFFGAGLVPVAAKAMCGGCPVKTDCGELGITESNGYGIWGGERAVGMWEAEAEPGKSPFTKRVARLSDAQIMDIRRRAAGEEKLTDIAADFGISRDTVRLYASGRKASHLPGAVAFAGHGPGRSVELSAAY